MMNSAPEAVPEVSVVVPAYNEERRLPGNLSTIISYLKEKPYSSEIIVVDDGSTDETQRIAQDLLCSSSVPGRVIRYTPNRGKGHAVRRGFSESRGVIFLFTDADLSTPIEEFDRLYAALESGADVAIASRALRDSNVQVHQPWYRERMGKGFNLLVRMVAIRGICDTQCGFKAFRGDAIRPMLPHLVVDGFAFDVEILLLARKRGMRIEQIPVRWRDDPNTRVSAIRDSSRMLMELLAIRWRALRGGYERYFALSRG
jgi:dolichyl-phosphate beta-glucosyltransferase